MSVVASGRREGMLMVRPVGAAKAAVAVFLVVSLAAMGAAWAPSAHAETSAQARSQIAQAYAALLSAQKSGGNVTALAADLNSAITLVQRADGINASDPAAAQALYAQAANLTSTVLQDAPAVAASGRDAASAAQIALVAETAVLGVLALVAYLYTPRLFWRVWLRLHRGWRVKKA